MQVFETCPGYCLCSQGVLPSLTHIRLREVNHFTSQRDCKPTTVHWESLVLEVNGEPPHSIALSLRQKQIHRHVASRVHGISQCRGSVQLSPLREAGTKQKKRWLEKVQRNGQSLENAPEHLRSDREVAARLRWLC